MSIEPETTPETTIDDTLDALVAEGSELSSIEIIAKVMGRYPSEGKKCVEAIAKFQTEIAGITLGKFAYAHKKLTPLCIDHLENNLSENSTASLSWIAQTQNEYATRILPILGGREGEFVSAYIGKIGNRPNVDAELAMDILATRNDDMATDWIYRLGATSYRQDITEKALTYLSQREGHMATTAIGSMAVEYKRLGSKALEILGQREDKKVVSAIDNIISNNFGFLEQGIDAMAKLRGHEATRWIANAGICSSDLKIIEKTFNILCERNENDDVYHYIADYVRQHIDYVPRAIAFLSNKTDISATQALTTIGDYFPANALEIMDILETRNHALSSSCIAALGDEHQHCRARALEIISTRKDSVAKRETDAFIKAIEPQARIETILSLTDAFAAAGRKPNVAEKLIVSAARKLLQPSEVSKRLMNGETEQLKETLQRAAAAAPQLGNAPDMIATIETYLKLHGEMFPK